jgi:hypothetical protein
MTTFEDLWIVNRIIGPAISVVTGGMVSNADWFGKFGGRDLGKRDANTYSAMVGGRNTTMWIGLSFDVRGSILIKGPRVSRVPYQFEHASCMIQTMSDPLDSKCRLSRPYAIPREHTMALLKHGTSIIRTKNDPTPCRVQWEKCVMEFRNGKKEGLTTRFVQVVEQAIKTQKWE